MLWLMKKLALAFVLIASPAFAQDGHDPAANRPAAPAGPDPTTVQRLLAEVKAQREFAMDQVALANARAAQLADQVQQLKAELDKAKQTDK